MLMMEPSSVGADLTRMRGITILLASCVVMASCGGGDSATEPTSDPTVNGSWVGPVSGLGSSVTLLLSEAADGSVTGEGTITNDAGESTPVTVVGSHAFPRVALLLVGFGSEVIVYNGTVAEGSITGTMSGSGFTDQALVLDRQ